MSNHEDGVAALKAAMVRLSEKEALSEKAAVEMRTAMARCFERMNRFIEDAEARKRLQPTNS
jgi:hypothetical protein